MPKKPNPTVSRNKRIVGAIIIILTVIGGYMMLTSNAKMSIGLLLLFIAYMIDNEFDFKTGGFKK